MARPAVAASSSSSTRPLSLGLLHALGLVGWTALLWTPRQALGGEVVAATGPVDIRDLCSDPEESEMSPTSDCYCLPHLVTLNQLKDLLKRGVEAVHALQGQQQNLTADQGAAPAEPMARSESAAAPDVNNDQITDAPAVKFAPGDLVNLDWAGGEASMSISHFVPGLLAFGGCGLRILRELGTGGSGSVFEARAVSQSTGTVDTQHVAVKQIKNMKYIDILKREYSFMHDFADQEPDLTVKPFILDTKYGVLVMELGVGDLFKDLDSQVEDGWIFPLQETVNIMFRLLSGLSIMHARGYAHRDLKPENIINIETDPGNYAVGFTDFGLACVFNTSSAGAALKKWPCKGMIGTTLYLPPEWGSPTALALPDWPARQDVWAAGIVFARMLAPYLVGARFIQDKLRKAPISAIDELEMWLEVESIQIDPELLAVLKKMLAPEPHRRPHASECVTMLKKFIPAGTSVLQSTARASAFSAKSALETAGKPGVSHRNHFMRTEAPQKTSTQLTPGSSSSTAQSLASESASAVSLLEAQLLTPGLVKLHSVAV